MVRAKIKKKYSGPSHLWQMGRIKEEAQLKKEYGYKNKKEIWKVESKLRNFRAQARRLIPLTHNQAKLEKKQLLDKLASLGLITSGAQIEDVLGLNIRDLLERRLQTLVYRKKLANTIKQARQLITHNHIVIGDKVSTSPSQLIRVSDENSITFTPNSSFVSEMHPERLAGKEKREKKRVKEEKKKEEDLTEAEKKVKEEEKKEFEEIKKLEGEVTKESKAEEKKEVKEEKPKEKEEKKD